VIPALGFDRSSRDRPDTWLPAQLRHTGTSGGRRGTAPVSHCSHHARKDVFVETKIWISDYGYEHIPRGC